MSTWSRLRRVRQIVQILALALYVYLLFAALPRRAAFSLADLFFRLDPLTATGAMLAARAWLPRLALALCTLALTLLLGRVWCGWLCPTGTLLEWLRLPTGRRQVSPRWRAAKNVLLLTILAMALFGSLSLLILDPLALLTRTMTTVVVPALSAAVTAVETTLYPVAWLQPPLDWLERALRGSLLPTVQPVFAQGVFIAALFVGIVALNGLADRFWCRYLCPLGALLGLTSKVALLRPVVLPACKRCGRCADVCRVGAIESADAAEILPAECTVCLDCLAACPQNGRVGEGGVGFRFRWRPDPARPHDPTRRQLLFALAAGAVGTVVLRNGPQAKNPHPQMIRPPGARDEGRFLSHCLRCGQCVRVCPTAGLQPALGEAGLEGLWTPRLVSRLGYCDYGCNACGQVCPSGAIPRLDLAQKRAQVLGLAAVERGRCLPWAYNTPCIVCEEMCPIPQKAIRLDEVVVTDAQGQTITLQRPIVLRDRCIGCGICENRCPMGVAAIQVYRR